MVPAGSNPLAGFAQADLGRLQHLVGRSALDPLTAVELIEARSDYLDLHTQPGASPAGYCRFLQATDGPIAIHLSRDEDWELLPAWLQTGSSPTDWQSLVHEVSTLQRDTLLQQGIDLGLAVASPDERPQGRPFPRFQDGRTLSRPPRILDLSTLWAGPLSGQLLRLGGAEVTKVDSAHRPDGARSGNQGFYAHLNGGKVHRVVDFRDASERAAFIESLAHFDIVIESARPRALPQLGIDPKSLLATYPLLTWVSITAYGRTAFNGMRVGYGDDVGIASGLSRALHAVTGNWNVVGDALADPLTGIRAAVSALESYAAGGGQLLDISLSATVIAAMEFSRETLGKQGFNAALANWWQEASC